MNSEEIVITFENLDVITEEIKEEIEELLKQPKYKNFNLRELITAPKEVNVHLGKN